MLKPLTSEMAHIGEHVHVKGTKKVEDAFAESSNLRDAIKLEQLARPE